MNNDPPPNGSRTHDGNGSRPGIEELIGEYIDRLNRGEKIGAGEILSEYPDLGGEIIDYLESFMEFGGDTAFPVPLGTIGDYTLRRQIGRGGMGVVYDAWENSMNRSVALKVLPAAIATDRRAYARFMREAQAAGQLNHPNLLPVHAAGFKERTPYYAMELIDGETLAQILARLRATKEGEDEKETPIQTISQLLREGDENETAVQETLPKAETTVRKSTFETEEIDLGYYVAVAKAFVEGGTASWRLWQLLNGNVSTLNHVHRQPTSREQQHFKERLSFHLRDEHLWLASLSHAARQRVRAGSDAAPHGRPRAAPV